MRPFGEPISANRVAEVRAAIAALFDRLPRRTEIFGKDYLMDPPDSVVIRVGEVGKKPGPRLRIGATEEAARPPFEWYYELTSDVTPSDYFKHYLVLEDSIALAHLKVLTPIDELEAQLIMDDLATAEELIDAA